MHMEVLARNVFRYTSILYKIKISVLVKLIMRAFLLNIILGNGSVKHTFFVSQNGKYYFQSKFT